jgi:hypothetical protein
MQATVNGGKDAHFGRCPDESARIHIQEIFNVELRPYKIDIPEVR